MLRARDTALDISMKSVGKQTSELLVLPRVGVGAEGVVNSPGKKVTFDMSLEGQEGICPRDEIREGGNGILSGGTGLGKDPVP